MPKRTDISSILVIGAGPIVIGQAAEFDYSGSQAVKALKAEGYRVIVVNSNPATIMTDPELADATYIEPITPEIVDKIIEKERPDALLPTMGGQTALNTALTLNKDGMLREVWRQADRRPGRGDRQGRGPRRNSARRWTRSGWKAPDRASRTISTMRSKLLETTGLPSIIRPSFTLGGTGGGVAYNREEFVEIVKSGPRRQPDHRSADRGIAARLEGI